MSDTCGPRFGTPFAYYDPDSSCVRTCAATFLSGSTESSVTLPASGIACGGRLYELPTLAPPIPEPVCSLLLPTPAVNDMGAGKTVEAWDEWTAEMRARHGNGNGHGKSLAIEAARLLPTPRTSDTNGAGEHGTGGPDLRTVVSLLPTPTARDWKDGDVRESSVPTNGLLGRAASRLMPTPRATDGAKGGPNQRGSSGDLMLPSAVQRLLPTPRVNADRTSRAALTADGQWSAPSLAQAVELAQGILPREYESWDEVRGWHGATTPPPSTAGSGSSGDPPRLPPTTEDG